jgi:uncharacterized secreted repeat protein (TIGR03808 family)
MDWTLDRRNLIGLAAAGLGVSAASPSAAGDPAPAAQALVRFDGSGLADASDALERALRMAAAASEAVLLAPGRITVRKPVRLPDQALLLGALGRSVIVCRDAGRLVGDGARDVLLSDFRIEGDGKTPSDNALIELSHCRDVRLMQLVIADAAGDGLRLWRSGGRLQGNRIVRCGASAIRSGESLGLVIADNEIDDIANNAIVVWRETAGTDSSQVVNNRIGRVRADAGGSGQNGNGINVFRADHVLVANNTIADCAFSAVRCNAASNVQIVANNCRNLGEVALYAEFAFEGAVIANNIVANAATGIEVTNFNDGGRLVSVQGNVIRDLFRREAEPVDKRGAGIAVEADTCVSGNTIEGAPTAGLMIGWGRYVRQVNATGNVIRDSSVGIAISSQGRAGSVLLCANMVSGAREGHVRLFDHGVAVGDAATAADGRFGAAHLSANMFT